MEELLDKYDIDEKFLGVKPRIFVIAEIQEFIIKLFGYG